MGGLNHRHTFNSVWSIDMRIALGVFAAVVLVMLYSFVRSAIRKRRDEPPSGKIEYTVKESLYTGFVAVMVGAITFLAINANTGPSRAVHPVVTLRVVGYQWCWRFTYLGTPVTVTNSCTSTATDPVAVLPAGEPIHVEVTSVDVIHGFWVPYLRFKMWAYPDHVNSFDTVIPAAGTYVGRCSEFCGLYHYDMHFDIKAVRPAAYTTWLTSMEKKAGATT